MDTAVTMQGTVNKYFPEKAYGFIRRDDGERDAFFHISKVVGKKPEVGDRVSFELVDYEGRPRAINVQGQ